MRSISRTDHKKAIVGAVLAIGLVALTGCGSTTKHAHVSAEEVNLALARQTLALASIKCIRAERQPGIRTTVPEVSGIDHAIRELITAYRKNPKIMHTGLAEEAENVQSCWPWLAREIRTVLTYG